MRLGTRLRLLEAALDADDPGVLIVFEDEDGAVHDGQGTMIDLTTIHPPTQVIRFRQHPDGPQ